MSHWTDTVNLSSLSDVQLNHLLSALDRADLLHLQPDCSPSHDHLLSMIATLDHTSVVLSLSADPTEMGMDIMEVLLRKSIYLCARGETGEPLTDIRGRPLCTPIGHRRGEEPTLTWQNTTVIKRSGIRMVRRDNRVIISVEPNPKDPTRAVWKRYEHYRVGAVIEDLIETTPITRADVRWDLRQGHIVALPRIYALPLLEQQRAA